MEDTYTGQRFPDGQQDYVDLPDIGFRLKVPTVRVTSNGVVVIDTHSFGKTMKGDLGLCRDVAVQLYHNLGVALGVVKVYDNPPKG